MKISRVFAALLALCMVLTCVPAMAATYQATGSTLNPAYLSDETVVAKIQSTGVDGTNLKIVVQNASDLGITAALSEIQETYMDGVTLTANVTYTPKTGYLAQGNNAKLDGETGVLTIADDTVFIVEHALSEGVADETVTVNYEDVKDGVFWKGDGRVTAGVVTNEGTAPETITVQHKTVATSFVFNETPVNKVMKNLAGTLLCPVVSNAALQAAKVSEQADLPLGETWGQYRFSVEGYDGNYLQFNRGTQAQYLDGGTADTGVFPEGTVFITDKNMTQVANGGGSTLTYSGIDYGYNVNGKFTVFVPQATGTYYVYGLHLYYGGVNGQRYSKILLNTTAFTFKATDGVYTDSAFHPYWCKADGTIELEKNVPVLMRRDKYSDYDRFAGVALVPADASGNDPMASVSDSNWIYTNLPTDQTDFNTWESATMVKATLASDVTVTVNGVQTKVEALGARKAGYDKWTGSTENDVYIPKTDYAGNAITYPTVLDALIAATSPEEGNTTYKAYDKTKVDVNDGQIEGVAVMVNGENCYAPGKIQLKDGDVVETKAYNKATFYPVALYEMYSSHGATCILTDVGTHGTSWQFVTNTLANTNTRMGFDALTTPETGDMDVSALSGIYVGGYMTIRDNVRWNGTNLTADAYATLDQANSKVHFEVVKVASALNNNKDKAVVYPADATEAAKVAYKTTTADDLRLVGDNSYVLPPYSFGASNNYYDYRYYTLAFLNTSTTNKIKVQKLAANGNYALINDGYDLVTVITVTYDDDGLISETSMVTDQAVAWNTVYTGKVAHNQKAFVWSAKALDGTTMQPLCEPILGSDFVN